jgi:MYXO-CTERM domain-containing protein
MNASLLSAAFVLTVARASRAEQFVLFDATFPYTWDDAVNASPSKSHYYVNEGNWLNKARPANWQSPVNYRDGSVHIRVEVIEKPAGGQMVGWALCYVGNSGSYGCPYTPYYTQLGVYERDVDMHSFFNNATINWAQGIKQVDLVYTINDSGSGHITNYPALKDLTTPTKVRITMIQVSQGSKYDPTQLPGADGGAPEAGRDGGARVDASADAADEVGTAGAGGTGGSGGASGSGGSGGLATGGAPGQGTGSGRAGGAAAGGGGQTQGGSAGAFVAGGGGASAGTDGPRGNDDMTGGCACSTRSSGHAALGGALLALLSASWIARRRRNAR